MELKETYASKVDAKISAAQNVKNGWGENSNRGNKNGKHSKKYEGFGNQQQQYILSLVNN